MHQVQSLTVLRPLDAALPSIRLGLKLGSKLDGNSAVETVTGMREQAEEKSSAEKDGKYCSPGHNRSRSAVLRRPCVTDRRLPTRLQRRRTRGLCVLCLWHPCYYCHMQTADACPVRGSPGSGAVLRREPVRCVIARLPFVGGGLELLLFGMHVVFSSKNSQLSKWEDFRGGGGLLGRGLTVITWMVIFQGKHL